MSDNAAVSGLSQKALADMLQLVVVASFSCCGETRSLS